MAILPFSTSKPEQVIEYRQPGLDPELGTTDIPRAVHVEHGCMVDDSSDDPLDWEASILCACGLECYASGPTCKVDVRRSFDLHVVSSDDRVLTHEQAALRARQNDPFDDNRKPRKAFGSLTPLRDGFGARVRAYCGRHLPQSEGGAQ